MINIRIAKKRPNHDIEIECDGVPLGRILSFTLDSDGRHRVVLPMPVGPGAMPATVGITAAALIEHGIEVAYLDLSSVNEDGVDVTSSIR